MDYEPQQDPEFIPTLRRLLKRGREQAKIEREAGSGTGSTGQNAQAQPGQVTQSGK